MVNQIIVALELGNQAAAQGVDHVIYIIFVVMRTQVDLARPRRPNEFEHEDEEEFDECTDDEFVVVRLNQFGIFAVDVVPVIHIIASGT